MRNLILSLAAVGAAALVPAIAQERPADPGDMPRTLSVTGEGQAFGSPDLALMSFAVVTDDKTARGAVEANAERMSRVRDALKELGIEARDMQTTGFNLDPQYSQDDRGRMDTSKIVGYRAANTLSVRLRDIEGVGAAIDRAVGAGANSLSNLSFDFQDSDKILEEARRNAMADARAQAELLAEEARVRLGKVMTISMHSYRPGPQPMMRRMAMDEMASTPIETGESSLSATVNVTYEIR
jgi:uncharacterized protein YggE